MRATWLPDVLRSAGCDVYELPGWRGRGHELGAINGLVWHHTVTGPRWADGHVAALLRDGHRKLPGPLSQLGLERDGTFVVVADGRANHNGYGRWGNASLGIEAYNDGVGETWPQAQLDAWHIGSAAILAHLGYGADRMQGHRETDPDRKIDPNGIDLDAARLRIARLISTGLDHQELTMDAEATAAFEDVTERLDGLDDKLDRLIKSAQVDTARQLEDTRGTRRLLQKFGLAK